jgi:hypothetical protein
MAKRGKLQLPSAFIAGGEGGGNHGPARQRQGISGLPVRQHHSAHQFPLSRVSDGWASVSFCTSGMSRKGIRAALFMARPITIAFPFSHNETNLEIMKSHVLMLQN